jgi:hypothetical protein
MGEMYQLQPEPTLPGAPQTVKRLSDNAIIPFDERNADYQEYLKWLEEGNRPLPAEK